MKTHFSFIIGILLGITLSFGFCSISGANPPQKGVVTAGLVHGLGISVPQGLETKLGIPQTPAMVSAAAPVHQANTIPATVGALNQIVQTSGETMAESNPQMETSFPDLTSGKDETSSMVSQPVSTQPISADSVGSAGSAGQMVLAPNEPERMLLDDQVPSQETAFQPTITPLAATAPNVPPIAAPDSVQETEFSVDSQSNIDEESLKELMALDSPNENSASESTPSSNLNQSSDKMTPQSLPARVQQTVIPQNSPMVLASTSPAIGAQIQPVASEETEIQSLPVVPEVPAAQVSSIPPSTTPMELKPAETAQESNSVPTSEPVVNPLSESARIENPVAPVQGSGKPGDAVLEGLQTTRLSLQKEAPEEIQVGQPSTWTISVRNEGKITAIGVQIHDSIPEGTKLVNTYPAAQVSETGEITWKVGNMPSGTMASVKMELIPLREGEIGSVANVTASTEASVKSIATRPLLKVETFGDAEVLLGNETELNIVVSNPGTGTTRNIVLSETVPAELQFEGGAELRYEVGDLAPGASKTVKLPLKAVRPGKVQNRLIAKATANLVTESMLAMEVTAPALKLELQGPSKRFLDKEGTFRLCLTNTGTAAARNIEMKTVLPVGWKFVRANNLGTHIPEQQAVVWKLEELGAGTKAETELVLLPNEIGNFALVYSASADSCQAVNGAKNLTVEGIAALMFQVVDSNDPIQIGEETHYTVEVVNQGSKQAEEVQVVIDIPEGLQLISSEESAHSVTSGAGRQIAFTPIPTLGPKASKIYRFTMRGVASGDQRIAVKLSSKEFPTPIVKEESTRVFAE